MTTDQAGRRVESGSDLDLFDIIGVLWGGRWLIASIVAAGFALSLTYALMAPRWYTSEVLLAPVEADPSAILSPGLSGLATLAGVGIGAGTRTTEARAILESEDFTREFIEQENLLPLLFSKEWDEALGKWRAPNQTDWPDVHDGARFFSDEVRRVHVNRETGLVRLSINWHSPELAAAWANKLVSRVNAKMRERARAEAQSNLEYLKQQLDSTSLIPLQQSISSLLESELQKLMLAERTEEFAFRILDKAEPAKSPSKPNKALSVVLGLILSGIAGVVLVLLRYGIRQRRVTEPR